MVMAATVPAPNAAMYVTAATRVGSASAGITPKKMRTARNAVQHAKTERGVGMTHTANPARSCLDVQMIVLHRAVDVRCRRQVHAAAERPHADDDERGSDEAFAPP